MNKKAQLGPIEAKYFLIGFVIAVILIFLLVLLANKTNIIPFRLGFLCPSKVIP